jgi:hypothetical protein
VRGTSNNSDDIITVQYTLLAILQCSSLCIKFSSYIYKMGYVMAQLVEALRYKPEGRGFDSRLCNWNFSLTWSFWLHCGPGVDLACNRNEYQEYFLGGKGGWCVGLTTLPPSCADCLKIWEPQPPRTLRAVQTCNGIALPFTFTKLFAVQIHVFNVSFLPTYQQSADWRGVICTRL